MQIPCTNQEHRSTNQEHRSTNQEHPSFSEGFTQPTRDFFHFPNSWMYLLADLTSLAEIKILLYVMRHTWGYQEYGPTKAITLDEFMHGRKRRDGTRMDTGTGLSKSAVIEGIRRALSDGYLICETDETDGGRVKKSYALKMRATVSPAGRPGDATTSTEAAYSPEPEPEPEPEPGPSRVAAWQARSASVDPDSQRATAERQRQTGHKPGLSTYLIPADKNSFATASQDLDSRGQASEQLMSGILTPGVQNLDSRGQDSVQRSEKATQEKHLEKDTQERCLRKMDEARELAASQADPSTLESGQTSAHTPMLASFFASSSQRTPARPQPLVPLLANAAASRRSDARTTAEQHDGTQTTTTSLPHQSETGGQLERHKEQQEFFDLFDTLLREVSGNPQARYERNREDSEYLTTLLAANQTGPALVTTDRLRAVYLRLWHLPKDKRTGFYWREHMSIKAICKNYSTQVIALAASSPCATRPVHQYTLTALSERQTSVSMAGLQEQPATAPTPSSQAALASMQSLVSMAGLQKRPATGTANPYTLTALLEKQCLVSMAGLQEGPATAAQPVAYSIEGSQEHERPGQADSASPYTLKALCEPSQTRSKGA
ncbi:MAG TPA: hypothetical protein VGD98_22650 [Ktedonobacteraceae bacterium]